MNDLKIVSVVAIDNEKRQRNFDFLKKYLTDNNLPYDFILIESSDYLHLQKIYNDYYKLNLDKIVIRHDVDCILKIENIKKGLSLLQSNSNLLVYPFDSVTYIDPLEYSSNHNDYQKEKTLRFINNWPDDLTLEGLTNYIVGDRTYLAGLDKVNFNKMNYQSPLGYCYMFNIQAYKQAGLDNEYLLDYNFDDLERYERLTKLGFTVKHLPGTVYHLDHSNGEIGAKVRENKNFIVQNVFEYLKIINLSKKELELYVEKWPWIKD